MTHQLRKVVGATPVLARACAIPVVRIGQRAHGVAVDADIAEMCVIVAVVVVDDVPGDVKQHVPVGRDSAGEPVKARAETPFRDLPHNAKSQTKGGKRKAFPLTCENTSRSHSLHAGQHSQKDNELVAVEGLMD